MCPLEKYGPVESVIVQGNIAERVAELARTHHSGLIVMGLDSEATGARPGSTTYAVICSTPVPVLAVPAAVPEAGHGPSAPLTSLVRNRRLASVVALMLVAPSHGSAQALQSFEDLALRINLEDQLQIEDRSGVEATGRLTRFTRDEIAIQTEAGCAPTTAAQTKLQRDQALL